MGATIGKGSLRDRVLLYQRTGEGREELVREISERAYRFPRRSMGWDEDACGDFLLFVYPRLAGLLDRFRDLGMPFEPYLVSVLAWNLKSFARRKAEARACGGTDLRIVAIDREAEGQADGTPDACRAASAWNGPSADAAAMKRLLSNLLSKTERRQFLFLLLKCMHCLSPEDLRTMAGVTEVGAAEFDGILNGLGARLKRKEDRLEMLRIRRNRAYCLARFLETLIASEPDSERRMILSARLKTANGRMRNAMARMSRVGTAPTNKDIAEVLGVPKGTVDSGLYWVKRKLSGSRDPQASRPA